MKFESLLNYLKLTRLIEHELDDDDDEEEVDDELISIELDDDDDDELDEFDEIDELLQSMLII